MDRGEKEFGGVLHHLDLHTGRECLGEFVTELLHVGNNLCGVGACGLCHHHHQCRVGINARKHGVVRGTHFHLAYILHAQCLAHLIRLDDDVAKLFGRLQTSGIAHGIFVGIGALFAEFTGSSLNVLLSQHTDDVARHEVVVLHACRVEPQTHGVGFQTDRLAVADTLHTLYGRDDVDVGIVGEEFLIVASVAGQCHDQHVRRLSFLHGDTLFGHFGREQTGGLRHTVLHVHLCHVGVVALFKVNGDGSHTLVGGRRGHVGHALHTVDLLLQRSQYRLLHGLCIGTLVECLHHHGWWRNVGILLNGQRHQTQQAQDDRQHGNHRREHWAFDKSI